MINKKLLNRFKEDMMNEDMLIVSPFDGEVFEATNKKYWTTEIVHIKKIKEGYAVLYKNNSNYHTIVFPPHAIFKRKLGNI